MRNRILPIVNLLLILVCAGCIFYLTTRKYVQPDEIAQAETLLKEANKGEPRATTGENPGGTEPVANPSPNGTESDFNKTDTIYRSSRPRAPKKTGKAPESSTPTRDTAWIQKEIFPAIWTPTPTPTPTPSPTPAPPDLNSVAVALAILSIDGNTVEFQDKRKENSDPISMTVGGKPWETVDKDNKPITITLVSVDQDNARVMIGFAGNTTWVNMF